MAVGQTLEHAPTTDHQANDRQLLSSTFPILASLQALSLFQVIDRRLRAQLLLEAENPGGADHLKHQAIGVSAVAKDGSPADAGGGASRQHAHFQTVEAEMALAGIAHGRGVVAVGHFLPYSAAGCTS